MSSMQNLLFLLLTSMIPCLCVGQAIARTRPARVESLIEKYCADDFKDRTPCHCNYLKSYEPPHMELVSIKEGPIQCIQGFVTTIDEKYPCHNTILLSFVGIADLTSPLGTHDQEEKLNDVWGWTSTGGTEIAMVGLIDNTAFVDITDPFNPLVLGHLRSSGSGMATVWRDIKSYNNYAYIVSENAGHGLQVMELSQMVGLDLSQAPLDFEAVHVHYGFGSAHNIFINEDSGYAYIVGSRKCSGGLYMMDVGTNPAVPTFVGCFSESDYIHDVQCVKYSGPDVRYTDSEICFACNQDSVAIVDVSNKSNPILISQTMYIGMHMSHQGWLTEDHTVFLFGDEMDEQHSDVHTNTTTFALNIEDLRAPFVVGRYVAAQRATDHNLYIRNKHVFAANYQSGLQVLRIGDEIETRSDLELVAYFDVYPEGDDGAFNGAWSSYPYFPSGNVLISSVERGLFVVSVDTAASPPMTEGANIGPGVPLMDSDGTILDECKEPSTSCSGFFGRKEGHYMNRPFLFNLFCARKCVEDSEIESHQDDGWTCGRCRD